MDTDDSSHDVVDDVDDVQLLSAVHHQMTKKN